MKLTEHELRKSNFSYFLGKIVTILTDGTALPLDLTPTSSFKHQRHYGGLCEGFDEYGLWLRDTKDNTKSFYFYAQIQGIVEQKTVDEDHPLVKQALEKAKRDEARARQQEVVSLGCCGGPEPELTELSVEKLQGVLKEKRR